MSTHLYILSCNGLYKIGITSDINRRIKTLQTGNPYTITLEYIEERYRPEMAENYLHKCFKKNRVSGEWFKDLTITQIRSKLMMYHDQLDESETRRK